MARLANRMLVVEMGGALGRPAGIVATQLQHLCHQHSAAAQRHSVAVAVAALVGGGQWIAGSGGRTLILVGVIRRKPGLGGVAVAHGWEYGWVLVYLLPGPDSRHQSFRRSVTLKVEPVGWVPTVLCLGAR